MILNLPSNLPPPEGAVKRQRQAEGERRRGFADVEGPACRSLDIGNPPDLQSTGRAVIPGPLIDDWRFVSACRVNHGGICDPGISHLPDELETARRTPSKNMVAKESAFLCRLTRTGRPNMIGL